MKPDRTGRARFVLLAAIAGAAALWAGARLFVAAPAPPRHPITGRQIAGTATNAGWMDRAEREGEEQPVYHELQHPQEMLRSIRRPLKPAGRLVLVEYRKEDPRIPIADTHRMSVADARTEVEAEGFVLDYVAEGLPRQHIIVFRRGAP